MCITPVRTGSYGQRSRHRCPAIGPCSGVGEAGRPGGQRRSEITAAATGVGGLALWRGHPARRCRPSSVHRAAGAPYSSVSFIAITSVRPCLLRTAEAGWRGAEAPNLPYPVSRSQSRTPVNDARPWKLYTPPGMCPSVCNLCTCHSIRRTDRRTYGR